MIKIKNITNETDFKFNKDKIEMSLSADDETSDSYFRSVLRELFSSANIEQKTEYTTIQENFTGAKLSFLARYGHIPLLGEFVETFERKRVSFDRKGRKEIVMALAERKQEMENDRLTKLRGLFGI